MSPLPPPRPLAILGAAVMVIGALLTPLGVLLGEAHEELTTEDRFVEMFTGLAADPEVQGRVAELVIGETGLPALARQLSEWGAPPWLTDPFEDAVADGLESFLIHLLQTDTFAIAWEETLRSSHSQVLAQLASSNHGGRDAASPLVLNIEPVLIAIRDALMKEGTTIAHLIPQVEHTVVLLPARDVATLLPFSTAILRLGPWAPWAPIALIALGAACTRKRWTWLAVAATVLALTAMAARALASGGELQERFSTAQMEPITAAATRAFLDATFSSSLSSLTVVAALSAGAAVAAGCLSVIRYRSLSRPDGRGEPAHTR